MSIHIPVLLNEVLGHLEPVSGKTVIDSTFGGGGHSIALAQKGAIVFAIDSDPESIREGERLLSSIACPTPHRQTHGGFTPRSSGEVGPKSFSFPGGGNVKLIHGRFSQLKTLLGPELDHLCDAVLFDLGLSSDQLASSRGFSFQRDDPLDMRYDPTNQSVTAADLVQALGEKELYEIFDKYSDEQHARSIARALVLARQSSPVRTTGQLVDLIESISSGRGKIHPATKVFQALRMAVNTEKDELSQGLPQSWQLLKPKGLLMVISFHSGEDRIVKNFAKSMNLPISKPIPPAEEEIKLNPRSRSAKLRVITKPAND